METNGGYQEVAADFLTTGESAKILEVGPDAVRRMEQDGILPAAKTATGRRIFHRLDVERLRDERSRRKAARR